MTTDFDTIVIGAGVIGLAVARELAMAGQQVLVIEKAARAGTETTARNSEVIHAGIYYPKGSLKAELCVEGRTLLYEYCTSHGVATKRLGKIIAATSAEEEMKLQSIHALALDNGVADLQWLSASDVQALEPDLLCSKALFSPSTGIVDVTGYVMALQGDAQMKGADFAFNTAFVSALKRDGFFVASAADAGGEAIEITSQQIVNCAGHGAHEVACAVGGIAATQLPQRFLAKGNYCTVSGKSPFTHLVYPVPVSGALGIHATLDMAGSVRFGPDIQWVGEVDYSLPDGLPQKFSAAIASYWPAVSQRTLTPSYCGIRPKIHGPQSGFADFLIHTEQAHGIKGLVNLFGIESPGVTSSLAIARRIAMSQQKAEIL